MDKIYFWAVKRRNSIVRLFVVLDCILAFVWLAAYWAIVLEQGNARLFTANATLFGKIAIVLYILTTIPGIFRRFGKFYKPVSVLMIFRRYIGIMTFMFVLLHASIVRFFWVVKGQMKAIPDEVFILFGSLAFTLLFSLFITSNDWSVKKMGKWWHWIHNLTYITGVIIFFHVALQEVNVWSALIALDALAIAASFIFAQIRRRNNLVN